MIYLVDDKLYGELHIFIIDEKFNKKKLHSFIKKIGGVRDFKIDELNIVEKRVKKNKSAHAVTIFDIYPINIVYFYKWDGDALDYGALSHEIFHLSDESLRMKGFKLKEASCEAWAYKIGFITRELINQLWKK